MAEKTDAIPKRKRTPNVARKMKNVVSVTDMTRQQGGGTSKNEPSIVPREPPVPVLKNIVNGGAFSNPFERRLEINDDAESLFLPKREVEERVLEFLKEGEDLDKMPMPVTVYDERGRGYEAMLKKWEEKRGYRVVNGGKRGWTAYYLDHALARGDFVAVWAFRHVETRLLCFVVISRRDQREQMTLPPRKRARS